MKTSVSAPTLHHLRSEPVNFDSGKGLATSVDAVVQDTMPQGSSKGTIIALHGAPGSHNCFKYVIPHATSKGIRVVAINFPGFGTTAGHDNLEHTNTERNNYIRAIVDALGIQRNIVFMGHSRGAENALQCAVLSKEKCAGAVLANPTGLRMHKTYPSKMVLQGFSFFYDTFVCFQFFWNWLLYNLYNKIMGMRVKDGRTACVAFRCLEHIEFGGHKKWVDEWNARREGKLVIAYGGEDHLIEEEISQEFSEAFSDSDRLEIATKDVEGEKEAIEWMKSQSENGKRALAVAFKKDDHFLQKHKARFLAEAVDAILEKNNNN